MGACSSICSSADGNVKINDAFASDMQLNAFEFREYRTGLSPNQHKTVTRVVNNWISMLATGKTLRINDFDDKLYLDKDLCNLEYAGELYPLRSITKLEMFKDDDDMTLEYPWGLDIIFSFLHGDSSMRINFNQDRHRLGFVLCLRVLRARDPKLEASNQCEVICRNDSESENEEAFKPFKDVVKSLKFDIAKRGIPIVFSVTELKIIQKMILSGRQVFIEIYTQFPERRKFLYVKSTPTYVPLTAVEVQEQIATKRKNNFEQEHLTADEKKEAEEQALAAKQKLETLCSLRFGSGMRQVKMKVPRCPHKLFGRLLIRDEFNPMCIGTFEIDVTSALVQERRTLDPEEKAAREAIYEKNRKRGKEIVVDGMRRDPAFLDVPVYKAYPDDPEKPAQIGTLCLRLLGFLKDPAMTASQEEIHARRKEERHRVKAEQAAARAAEDEAHKEEEDELDEMHDGWADVDEDEDSDGEGPAEEEDEGSEKGAGSTTGGEEHGSDEEDFSPSNSPAGSPSSSKSAKKAAGGKVA